MTYTPSDTPALVDKPLVLPPEPRRSGPPATGLYRAGFSTIGLDAEDRALAYVAAISAIFDTTSLASEFEATLDMYVLGSLTLAAARASARRTARTPEIIARDGYDPIALQLTFEGRAHGEADGRPIATGPGDLIVLDNARPYVVEDEGPRRGLTVVMSRALMLTIHPDPASLHGVVFGPAQNGLLAAHLHALLPRLVGMPNTSGGRLARVIVQLISLMLDAPEPAAGTGGEARRQDVLTRRALAFIDAHLTDPDLAPAAVARGIHVSRTRLYKAFEAVGGVAQHIWRRRLAAVREALIDPAETRSIADLARHWGFASETHFSRAFRISFGASASDVRRLAKSGREG